MLLRTLGIYGWSEIDEDLVLASLLTGDPLLLIGNHGCAKTHVAHKVAQALGRAFLVYDASKAMFEDVLGYPNVEKLKHGVVEYVPSPVTIWDKELVLIDELNRAAPELQSKWLEIIRSRRIMGFPTRVKWVWAAMNPFTYSATTTLDEALIGRFALFLYPPDVLRMEEEDRIQVAMHINGDDAPGLGEWSGGLSACTVPLEDVRSAGDTLRAVLTRAGGHFLRLRTQLGNLAEFLAKFADLLARETHGAIALDGRRLGFLHRSLLAHRAVEVAKAELGRSQAPDFVRSARYVVQSGIPVGINPDSPSRDEAVHAIEICFDLLGSYFEHDAEWSRVNRIYELFTTPDPLRKAELLLAEDLGTLASSKAWTDLMAGDDDLTLLAYTALQVETRRPGTVPQELLAPLSAKVNTEGLSARCLPPLENEDIEHLDDVEAVLHRENPLAQLVAYQRMSRQLLEGRLTPDALETVRRDIDRDIARFEALLAGTAQGEHPS